MKKKTAEAFRLGGFLRLWDCWDEADYFIFSFTVVDFTVLPYLSLTTT